MYYKLVSQTSLELPYITTQIDELKLELYLKESLIKQRTSHLQFMWIFVKCWHIHICQDTWKYILVAWQASILPEKKLTDHYEWVLLNACWFGCAPIPRFIYCVVCTRYSNMILFQSFKRNNPKLFYLDLGNKSQRERLSAMPAIRRCQENNPSNVS